MQAMQTTILLFFCCLTTAVFPGNPNLDEVRESWRDAAPRGLYIEGSRKFKLQVVRDLQRLTRYRLDIQFFSGKVIIYGVNQGRGRKKDFGDRLIRELVYSGKRMVIKYATDGTNRFLPNSHTSMILKEPVGGTIMYHPKRKLGGMNIFNKRNRPPYVGLAHELVHAWHGCTATAEMRMLTGDCLLYEDEITVEEHFTRMQENKIRAELGISPRRVPQASLACLHDEQTANELRSLIDYMCRKY